MTPMGTGPINPIQFYEIVRGRHRNNQPFSADEIDAMSDEQFSEVLDSVAAMQRGEPERAMNDIQRYAGSGYFSYAAEHVGDLTHRINERGGAYGRRFVAPKVRTTLGMLTELHGTGFGRRVREDIEANDRFARERGKEGVTEEGVRQRGEAYSQAHERLPAYNQPSFFGRNAAVALGRMEFSRAASSLSALQGMLDRDSDDPQSYDRQMTKEASAKFIRQQEELRRSWST